MGSENFFCRHPHIGKANAAAVGLPLAHIVPVALHLHPFALGRHNRNPKAFYPLLHRAERNHVGIDGARAKALGAMDAEARSIGGKNHPAIERVEAIAPKPVVLSGLAIRMGSLLRAAKHMGSHHPQMLIGKQVGDGAIYLGKAAGNVQGRFPRCPQAAILGGDDQLEQVALAQTIALSFGRTTLAIALHRCGRKFID